MCLVTDTSFTFYNVVSKFLAIARPGHFIAFNCFDMQALPIFLDSLVQAWGAILISVTLILLFGEVSIRYFPCGPSESASPTVRVH